MNNPLLVAPWQQINFITFAPPATSAAIVPGAFPSQLIAIDDYATNRPVPLIGNSDVGGLRVVLYAWDVTKGGLDIKLNAETTGELKTSLYASNGAGLSALKCEATGELDTLVKAPDSVSGLPVSPVVIGDALKVISAGAAAATGASINGTAAASGIIKPANAVSKQVIIQNVDPAETLYLSFNNPATVDDITLLPGASITYNAGVANAIYGLGSGAGAKYSIQELS